tara:strand:- start:128 stop:295 length:168 start_codon:yes stop_codon:yes gene_type:complete
MLSKKVETFLSPSQKSRENLKISPAALQISALKKKVDKGTASRSLCCIASTELLA